MATKERIVKGLVTVNKKVDTYAPNIPSQVLQVAPFPLMILTLLLVNIGDAEWVDRTLAALPESMRRFFARAFRALRASPPAALGVPFERD